MQRSHSFACTHLLTMATLAAVGALNTASAQTIGVATGGAGGAIPALGTGGGGSYPTVMPPSPGVFTLPVATVPPGATVVSQVNLIGLSHARVGDLQFVLIDPFGSQHNVSCRVGDYACGYSGNYQLFPVCTGIGQPLPASCLGGGSLLTGPYEQNYGAGALLWPSGTNGIINSDLYVIPAATGVWTLMVYDWSAGALGGIASWEIGFGVPNCTPGGGGPPVTPPQPTCIAPPPLSTQLNPVTIEWSASTSTASNSRSTHKAKWRPLSGQGGGATQIGLQAFTNPFPPPDFHAFYTLPALEGGWWGWSARQVETDSSTGFVTHSPWSTECCFCVPDGGFDCSGCVIGGGAAPIPSSGTGGGGTFPTILPPPAALSSASLVVSSVPPCARVVARVTIRGLVHTFLGDVQFVLTEPSGVMHNLACRVGNFSCDYAGDYSFIPSCTGELALPTTCTGVTMLPPGAYAQNFGAWPNGTNNIFNTRLDTIAASAGTWTLTAYDWAGGDVGGWSSFEVCFGDAVAPTPPAAAPTLSSPADLATATNPVTLSWNAVACAATYDVDVDGVVTTGIGGTSFNAPVLAAGMHTWRVRAANASGTTAFSTPRSFTVPPPPPPSTCVAGGGGGLVPAAGTGGTGAVWPGTLPATPFTDTYAVTLPAGATQLVKVDLNFTTQHSWIGDLFVVLTDPTGGQHNLLHRVGSTGTGAGLNCDLNGAYAIYETAGLSWPTTCPASGDVPNGDYDQNVGAWPNGTNGIFNTPLGSIPVASGNWTLTIYDWAGGDTGTLGSWQLCFDNGAAGPTNYCTAGTSTNGCLPSISATTNPNLANNAGCVITCSNIEGQKLGLFFYGVNNTGFTPAAWGAGTSFLCVKGPTQRTPSGSSGGTFGQCDGTLSVDWDAFQIVTPGSLGNPFSAGDSIFVQTWYRDPPSPKTTNLSNAVELAMQP